MRHKVVPVSKSHRVRYEPGMRTWWRCLQCGQEWPYLPLEAEHCPMSPDAA